MTNSPPEPPSLAELVDRMTLEERVSVLAGADFWRTVAIRRLKVPQIKVTDGPAGARGGGALVGGKRTAAFPVGIALGATWSTELLLAIAWLSFAISIGGVALMYWLIRTSHATSFSSLFYLVPAVTALFAYLLFGEKLDALSLAGMAVCAVGVVVVNRAAPRSA